MVQRQHLLKEWQSGNQKDDYQKMGPYFLHLSWQQSTENRVGRQFLSRLLIYRLGSQQQTLQNQSTHQPCESSITKGSSQNTVQFCTLNYRICTDNFWFCQSSHLLPIHFLTYQVKIQRENSIRKATDLSPFHFSIQTLRKENQNTLQPQKKSSSRMDLLLSSRC